jgi:ectoine hydroxylase-related dioxygenase (phytanoyl-CoA dioxygenase family)
VPLPLGVSTEPVVMAAGDVMFFNGSLVHGSLPNSTTDRFRRSLIAHYVEGDTEELYGGNLPALRMDGTQAELRASAGGAPCGSWIAIDGQQVVRLADAIAAG